MVIKDDLCIRVSKLMGWPREKVLLWFSTPNPHFGNVSPDHLIERGRIHKVEEFIAASEDENRRDE